MAPLNLHINDVKPALTTTIRIRGVRWYAFRLKLGAALIHLGCWVAGSAVERIEVE